MTMLFPDSELLGQDISEGSSASVAPQGLQKQTIAITATFTAEPVEESLVYWMQELALPSIIAFAPYNQLFQQLLDPTSLLSHNQRGVNVILLRFEDWQRFETDVEQSMLFEEKIERHVHELKQALQVAVKRSATPYLLCVCPTSPKVDADAYQQAFFAQMEDQLAKDLAGISGVYMIKSTEMITSYPVSLTYDPYGDKVGHIPFTPLFFAALGTLIARKIYALLNTPYKVIVLDCDQTLWQGICGEDGTSGVVIDEPRKQLQEFLVAQQAAGMLLCVCSKNNERDVFDVFARHPDMQIKLEHLVAWRINWQAKSRNLRSLAEELQLSLESFIFIDDDPLECDEVQTNCPEVLTLSLPKDLSHLPHLLQHFWAFDHMGSTSEDKKRTVLYEQQLQRQRVQKASSNLKDFLDGLELHIEITPAEEGQLRRVAQLTQRTNQFNCTTIRRTESELRQFCQVNNGNGGECLVVEVRDRFGDYGLVGVILFSVRLEEIEVDTFLLSCRALGRGVEHQMVAKIGKVAQERGVGRVFIPFIPTSQNIPAHEFLESIRTASKQFHRDRRGFSFATQEAIKLVYTPLAEKSEVPSRVLDGISVGLVAAENVSTSRARIEAKGYLLRRIATDLSTTEQVLQAVSEQRHQLPKLIRDKAKDNFVAPTLPIHYQLVQIWEDLLGVRPIGIKDDFFDLGGHSLLAVRLFNRITQLYGKELPLSTLFAGATIEHLVTALMGEARLHSQAPLVTMQVGGSKRPFFYLHGEWEGGAFYCMDIVRYQDPDQPFYLLEPYKFDGKEIPPSFEAIAAAHVETLRAVQPEGPYLLGGFCNGGLIAYEMAQQLQVQGQAVDLLVLLDPASVDLARRRLVRRMVSLFGNLIRCSQNTQFDWYICAHHIYKYLRLPSYRHYKNSELLGNVEQDASGVRHEKVSFGHLDLKLKALVPNVEALRKDYLNIYEWAALNYTLELYPGKITFLWTSEESHHPVGWRKVVKAKEGEVEIHMVPGNHLTIRTKHLNVLAEKLKICISKAQETSS